MQHWSAAHIRQRSPLGVVLLRLLCCLALPTSDTAAAESPPRLFEESAVADIAFESPKTHTLWGDFDGDGKEELLRCTQSGECDSLEFHNDSLQYTKVAWQISSAPSSELRLIAAACNEDECLDIVLEGQSGRECRLSDCSAGFREAENRFLSGATEQRMLAAAVSAGEEAAVPLYLHEEQHALGLGGRSLSIPGEVGRQAARQLITLQLEGKSRFLVPMAEQGDQRALWRELLVRGEALVVSEHAWAAFPPPIPLRDVVVLHASDERSEQLLALTAESREAFLAIAASPEYAIEFPLRLPLSVVAADEVYFLDMDGDGLDDVLSGSAGRFSLHRNTGQVRSEDLLKAFESARDAGMCIGYHPGDPVRWGRAERLCPQGYAAAATNDVTNNSLRKSKGGFVLSCCPLPPAAFESAVRHWRERECAANELVVGVERRDSGSEELRKIACQGINTSSYVLGQEEPAVYWGAGGSNSFSGAGANLVRAAPQRRVGIRRVGYTLFSADTCSGADANSFLWSFTPARGCQGFSYRSLIAKEREEQQRMTARCDALSSLFEPQTSCITPRPLRNTESPESQSAGQK